MTQIPITHKKLREAKYFFHHLSGKEGSLRLDSEEFDFYLSAFLSASWSVSEFLQAELFQTAKSRRQKSRRRKWHELWFADWKKELTHAKMELWEFVDGQRGKGVHNLGANAKPKTEHIPLSKIPLKDRGHPAYGVFVSSPPELYSRRPTTVGQKVHYFVMGSTPEKAIDTCGRYLGIVNKLVHDFEQTSPP